MQCIAYNGGSQSSCTHTHTHGVLYTVIPFRYAAYFAMYPKCVVHSYPINVSYAPYVCARVVKTSPVSEAGLAQLMEQLNTSVRMCALYMQANFAGKLYSQAPLHMLSSHIILRMESKVNRHKTQSSLVCHVICVHT